MSERLEAELGVEAVCVVGLEDETNTCQLWEPEEQLDHVLAEAQSANARVDKHICNPGEGCIVGYRTTEANLQPVLQSIQAQTQGVLEGAGDYVTGSPGCPI